MLLIMKAMCLKSELSNTNQSDLDTTKYILIRSVSDNMYLSFSKNTKQIGNFILKKKGETFFNLLFQLKTSDACNNGLFELTPISQSKVRIPILECIQTKKDEASSIEKVCYYIKTFGEEKRLVARINNVEKTLWFSNYNNNLCFISKGSSFAKKIIVKQLQIGKYRETIDMIETLYEIRKAKSVRH